MNEFQFEDIKLDMAESFSVQVSPEMMEMFLGASGDHNPLHLDSDYAQGKGFRDKVVYGMLSSVLYSTLAGVHLPGRFCLLQGIQISFHNPAYVDDRLTVHGKVSHINEAYRVIELKASITNQDGKRISKAKLQIGFL